MTLSRPYGRAAAITRSRGRSAPLPSLPNEICRQMLGLSLLSIAALLTVSALCLSILIFQGITGVPPLSSNSVEAADVVSLLKEADLAERAVVYELGSGWDSLVIALARARAQKTTGSGGTGKFCQARQFMPPPRHSAACSTAAPMNADCLVKVRSRARPNWLALGDLKVSRVAPWSGDDGKCRRPWRSRKPDLSRHAALLWRWRSSAFRDGGSRWSRTSPMV